MNLLFQISSDKMKDTYDRIKSHLKQDQQFIFQAMQILDNNFEIPDESKIEKNHIAIKRKFDFRGFNGIEIFLRLIPQIYKKLEDSPYYKSSELDAFLLETATETKSVDIKLILTKGCIWTVNWPTKVSGAFGQEDLEIPIFLYNGQLDEIVPAYIVELLSSAISAYTQNLYMPSLILATIALEATLRKVLSLRGYSSGGKGTSKDEYSFIDAKIGPLSDKSGYMLRFNKEPAKSSNEYYIAESDKSVPVRIKRKYRDKDRYDIIIRDFDGYEDYLTSDVIITPQQKRISGLGGALSIARYDEGILTDIDLPTDMDEIFKSVRNNLIHISEDSFSATIGDRRLSEILSNQLAVYDLIFNVSNYINKQYLDINKFP